MTRIEGTLRPKALHAAVVAVLQSAALTAHAADTPQELPKISVGAEEPSYKVDMPSSPKYTELLRDTPQTITIVPRQLIEDQKLMSLREILGTVPGITFGAGEGGGGYGDSISLRGFTGSNDITLDGVRDSAQYSRTDPFNLEQVEVVNGASSVYSGAGSVGGSINLVSKQAHAGDQSVLSAGAGTDNYLRFTSDVNQQFTPGAALRVNAMVHRNDVAGRDYEKFERWGVAPSLVLGLDSDTTVALNYLHQSDDNIPQYGVPFYEGRKLPGIDSSNYYGYHNIDRQKSDVDSLTAIVTHRFSDNLSLRNLSRIQEVSQLSIVDAVQGTFCLSSGQLANGDPCEPAGMYLPSGPRGYGRDTENRIVYNQTDFTTSFATGPVGHTMVAGFSLSHETYGLDTSNYFRNPDGSNPFSASGLPPMDLYNPDSTYSGPFNRTLTGKSDAELDNVAVYAFDTLKFSERWQLNAGLRYENNDGRNTSYTVSTVAPIGAVTGTDPPAKNEENLLSHRAGLIFKPQEEGTLYFAYGNSKTPAKLSVMSSCRLTPTRNRGVNCNVDPETAVNYELGTKWDLLDNTLALTAAVFRNERRNYSVSDPDPANVSGEEVLDGRARVDGLMLGAGGNITDVWAVTANYAYLDSKVVQGASDFVAASGQDFTKGDPLQNVPEHSFSVWTTYQLPIGLQLGYGATYQDEVVVEQHSADRPTGPLPTAPSYITHRVMAAYSFNEALDLQLNISNLFDKEYYTRVRTRSTGWATPGEGRTFILSANYRL